MTLRHNSIMLMYILLLVGCLQTGCSQNQSSISHDSCRSLAKSFESAREQGDHAGMLECMAIEHRAEFKRFLVLTRQLETKLKELVSLISERIGPEKAKEFRERYNRFWIPSPFLGHTTGEIDWGKISFVTEGEFARGFLSNSGTSFRAVRNQGKWFLSDISALPGLPMIMSAYEEYLVKLNAIEHQIQIGEIDENNFRSKVLVQNSSG